MDLILAFVNSIWHFTHHALISSGETMNYLWYADIIKKKSSILLLFNNCTNRMIVENTKNKMISYCPFKEVGVYMAFGKLLGIDILCMCPRNCL